jgi:hypothetical protein
VQAVDRQPEQNSEHGSADDELDRTAELGCLYEIQLRTAAMVISYPRAPCQGGPVVLAEGPSLSRIS